MFTGIIEAVGTIRRHVKGSEGVAGKLLIEAPGIAESAAIGDSIATNGVCLTLTGREGGAFWVDYSSSTLSVTTLGSLKVGDCVNLEQALTLKSRLGGHLVTGHVDGTGRVLKVEEGAGVRVVLDVPGDLMRYVVVKGSITVDGVSLTVVAIDENRVMLTIVPHTWFATTLARRRVGDVVNLEVDLIAKYVERLLSGHLPVTQAKTTLTLEGLLEQGYR